MRPKGALRQMRRKRASVSVCHQATKEPGGRHERDQGARPRNARRAKGEREPEAAAATTLPIDKLNATGRGRIPQTVTARTQASPKRNTQGGSRDRREPRGLGGRGAPVNEQAEPDATKATAPCNMKGARSARRHANAESRATDRARAAACTGRAGSAARAARPT